MHMYIQTRICTDQKPANEVARLAIVPTPMARLLSSSQAGDRLLLHNATRCVQRIQDPSVQIEDIGTRTQEDELPKKQLRILLIRAPLSYVKTLPRCLSHLHESHLLHLHPRNPGACACSHSPVRALLLASMDNLLCCLGLGACR